MFYKMVVPKNYAEFTWKHLRSVTLIKRDFSAGVFPKICEISKKNLFIEHLRTTASGLFHSLKPSSELIETKFFIFLNMLYHDFRTWWISSPLHLKNFILGLLNGVLGCWRASCALRDWRTHVLGLVACFTCSRAWGAPWNVVLGVLQKIGVFSVLHKMECLACFKKWLA